MTDAMDRRMQFATRLCIEAGALALDQFRRLDTLTLENKGPQDVVSEADREVEHFIRAALAERHPDDAFLGEETGRRGSGDVVWVVDPIDGTQCFLAGIPTWCVSIGLVHAGRPVGGVIHDPNTGETFSGQVGRGAFCNGQPMRPADAADFGAGMTEVGWSTRIAVPPTVRFIERLLDAGGIYHRGGSGALALAYVAAGRYIAYFEGHMNVWDSCAGAALVAAAGGWVNDVLANGGLERGSVVIACAPGLESALRALASEVGHDVG
jgi:myo-inositol-1(or 4)-monophosphatase